MSDTEDEFAFLTDNATDLGLAAAPLPTVQRVSVKVDGGRSLSALIWGPGRPDIVTVHGGGQNAHSWDAFALALGRPLVAIDLPGHGHSSWREDRGYSPGQLAADVAPVVRTLAATPAVIIGMSMGDMTAVALAGQHPELFKGLVLVDVTPNARPREGDPAVELIRGPRRFRTFDEMVESTAKHLPHRDLAGLRRGVRHNARQDCDGSWVWRYDELPGWTGGDLHPVDPEELWRALERLHAPVLLVRGGGSATVREEDVAELLLRRPKSQATTIDGAGHNVQGERPVELARVLETFLSHLSDGSPT